MNTFNFNKKNKKKHRINKINKKIICPIEHNNKGKSNVK